MRTILPLIAGMLILLLAGCAEKPKAIGGSLIDPSDIFTVADTVLIAVSDSSYTTALTGGSSSSMLVGRISPSEELAALYNFSDVGAVDSLVGARIDTAEIRLFVNHTMPLAAPPMQLRVHEALQPWAQSTFTTDSMKSFSLSAVTYGTISDSMNFGAQVSALLDSNLIRRWVKANTDTNAAPFYGIAIMADPGPAVGVVGFFPFDIYSTYTPRLVVKYTKNGVKDSVTFTAGANTYAARFSVPPVLAPFEIRGAFGVRSTLAFDVSLFRDKPIINNATVTLAVDTVNSFRSVYSPDSLIAMMIPAGKSADSASTTFFAIGTKKVDAAVGQTYVFNITTIAQRWVNKLEVNEGLAIRWAYEANTADKIVFHSLTDANPSKRPRVNITYSRK